MTSAGGSQPAQMAQGFLFTMVKEAALCSCTLSLNSNALKRDNYVTSEQAQEVKLTRLGSPQGTTLF